MCKCANGKCEKCEKCVNVQMWRLRRGGKRNFRITHFLSPFAHFPHLHICTFPFRKVRARTLRNGIISTSTPGMTAADAFDREPEAFEYTMFAQCFDRIMRTGGCVTTLWSNPWRNHPLIYFDQQNKGKSQYTKYRFHFLGAGGN